MSCSYRLLMTTCVLVATASALMALGQFEVPADQARHDKAAGLFAQGMAHQQRFERAQAVTAFLAGIELAEGFDHHSFRTRKMHAVGSVHALMGDTIEAPSFLLEVIHQDSAAGDTILMIGDHLVLADMYVEAHASEPALRHAERARMLAEGLGNNGLRGLVRLHLGEARRVLGDAPGAVRELEKALDLMKDAEYVRERIVAGDRLATAYMGRSQATEAERTALAALDLAHATGYLECEASLRLVLALAAMAHGDSTTAALHFKLHRQAIDEQDPLGAERAARQRYARFRALTKDQALQRSVNMMRSSQERTAEQRLQKFAFLALAVALAILALVLVNRYRLKRKAAEALEQAHAEALRQKAIAEESERVKDRFLANMSHEMRTPLNAMLGFSELLLLDRSDDRSRRFLEGIRTSGGQLLALINDVLDTSRLRAGKLQLTKDPFDLHACVRDCTAMLQHRALEQRDKLTVDIAPGVPYWVIGDGARLVQIILNLLGNAIKFTSDGDVRLRLERIEERVRITISDTGIGIPVDRVSDLFDRFTQVRSDDSRKHGGAGLGLSIVKELVQLHNGTISVDSEPGVGSEFVVELPLPACDPMPSPPAAEMHNGAFSGSTILVAEDNEMNAVVLTECLKRLYPAATIEVVSDGEAAIARATHNGDQSVDLIFMDIQMPGTDGLTAIRDIRAFPRTSARVPIIVLTANATSTVRERCLAAGADEVITKPFTGNTIAEAVARLTGSIRSNAAVQLDDSTTYDDLFRALIPERLAALREACASSDVEGVRRIVHGLSPQLEQRDAARFANSCWRIEDASTVTADVLREAQRLVQAIEEELA